MRLSSRIQMREIGAIRAGEVFVSPLGNFGRVVCVKGASEGEFPNLTGGYVAGLFDQHEEVTGPMLFEADAYQGQPLMVIPDARIQISDVLNDVDLESKAARVFGRLYLPQPEPGEISDDRHQRGVVACRVDYGRVGYFDLMTGELRDNAGASRYAVVKKWSVVCGHRSEPTTLVEFGRRVMGMVQKAG